MTDIVVGSGGDRWYKKPSWRFALLAVLVLVVAAGAGVGLQMLHKDSDSPGAASTSGKFTTVAAAITKAIDYTYSGKYAEANATLNNALHQPGLSTTDKYNLYIQQGSTYMNQKDYTKALAAYKQAMATQSTYVAAGGVGDAAANKGDMTTAIQYYQKAIDLIPTDFSFGGMLKHGLETKIAAAKEGKVVNAP